MKAVLTYGNGFKGKSKSCIALFLVNGGMVLNRLKKYVRPMAVDLSSFYVFIFLHVTYEVCKVSKC